MDKHEYQKRYELNRRQFLKMAGIGGAAVAAFPATNFLPRNWAYAQAVGKNAEERAINGALSLAKKAKKKEVTVMIPSGSEGGFAPYLPEWEKATGIKTNMITVPMSEIVTKCMNEAVTKSGTYDVMLPNPYGLPDLAESKLAMDLTDYVKKYNPELTGPNGVIKPIYLYGNLYKGRVYGLLTDGDINTWIIRRDWLNDERNKEAFEKKYGYPLKKPVLFSEVWDQMKFFSDPSKPRYGGWLGMSPYYAKWEFLEIFTSFGILPFDNEMRPGIAGKEGIQALKELIDVKQTLHPGHTTGGWSEQYKAYAEGTTWTTVSWPSFIKYNNNPKFSKAAGKMEYCQAPGRKLKDGTIFRPARFTFGWSYIVSRYSKIPELAYCWAQYMYSPTVSGKIVRTEGTFFDAFRYNHFKDPKVGQFYDKDRWKELLKVWMINAENSYPEIVLRGGEEYNNRLDENVIAAYQGQKSVEDALNDTAEQWEKITRRYGRKRQIEQWTYLISCMGDNFRNVMNLPDPPDWINKI